ncbi:uncharacterized protein LOC115876344 [Sitophilus oryzae]|uniref:Uncharacterized protein LOC115876344 n=1 Tax=Sitophilus oryzae TaxID=7048 RepID=A0A6J2XAT9_SITOR|nr:uncharacterized protein LOC115876344 [Sitophilus oryzae]
MGLTDEAMCRFCQYEELTTDFMSVRQPGKLDDCKKRWKNIKDTYNRRRKKKKSTGSAALPKQAKWALADMLSFLDQTEHKRPCRDRKERINDDIIATIKERSAERNEIFKKIGPSKPDSLDLFFQSIAASVKALRPELINEAKLRTVHLVFELEQRNAGEVHPQHLVMNLSHTQDIVLNLSHTPDLVMSLSHTQDLVMNLSHPQHLVMKLSHT